MQPSLLLNSYKLQALPILAGDLEVTVFIISISSFPSDKKQQAQQRNTLELLACGLYWLYDMFMRSMISTYMIRLCVSRIICLV